MYQHVLVQNPLVMVMKLGPCTASAPSAAISWEMGQWQTMIQTSGVEVRTCHTF